MVSLLSDHEYHCKPKQNCRITRIFGQLINIQIHDLSVVSRADRYFARSVIISRKKKEKKNEKEKRPQKIVSLSRTLLNTQ